MLRPSQAAKFIRRLDAYPRAEEHLIRKTSTGAVVSVLGIFMMAVLGVAELRLFLTPFTSTDMRVDVKGGELLPIHLNLTFPSLPCAVLSLDALDMSGKHEVDIVANITKLRVDKEGNSLGVFETPEEKGKTISQQLGLEGSVLSLLDFALVDTDEMVDKLQGYIAAHEGCNVHGHLEVSRVAGNFHVSVHSQSYFVLQQLFTHTSAINVSHSITRLSFGELYPGMINPLDGFVRYTSEEEGAGTFKYFLKVVPTQYNYLDGRTQETNQFSVTEYFIKSRDEEGALPAVYFLYDLSAITVNIEEKRRSIGHFFTRVCAVLGGTFAVTGMLDRWIHRLFNMST